MTFTEQVVNNFKRKYSAAYQLYIDGDKDILRWIIDNIESFKPDKPKYTVIAESRLLHVDSDGIHYYKGK